MLWKSKTIISSSGLTNPQGSADSLKDLIKSFEHFLETRNINPYVT